MGQQVLGHVPRVAGGHQLADGPAEGHVLLAAQEDAHEGREHQRHQEQDAHHHGERLGGQVDGGPLQPEGGHDHLDLEPGDRDGQQVHPGGGDRGLAPSGQEQRDDHVAEQEAEGHQERDPVGEEVRRRRAPVPGRYCRAKVKATMATVTTTARERTGRLGVRNVAAKRNRQ